MRISWHQFLLMCTLPLVGIICSERQRIPFQWVSCGNSSDVLTMQSLKVYQNESNIIFVTGKGNVNSDIQSPVSGKVEMKKMILGMWVPIPCSGDFGSCSYPDVCRLSPYATDCPEVFQENDLPCHCPIPEEIREARRLSNLITPRNGDARNQQGTYSVKSFPIDVYLLPKWLEKGLYSIRVVLNSAGKRVLCLKMSIDL